jgi:phosphoenolpyruvate carboxylase
MADTSGLSEDAGRVIRRFREAADWQREFGVDAIDTYCISWCEEPSHALEVLFLADQAGIVDLPGEPARPGRLVDDRRPGIYTDQSVLD